MWNCFNIYESAVSITSLLKTITDPLKAIKMVKTDPKDPSQIFFLLVPLGTIAQLFTKTNFPLHNPFKVVIFIRLKRVTIFLKGSNMFWASKIFTSGLLQGWSYRCLCPHLERSLMAHWLELTRRTSLYIEPSHPNTQYSWFTTLGHM